MDPVPEITLSKVRSRDVPEGPHADTERGVRYGPEVD
ncbi:hypothetical protein KIPB_009538, partial [Kipferlia bialata]|eukprot:g9538.t1